jgi:hypothetical protein
MNRISGLGDPAPQSDVVTKNYVDNAYAFENMIHYRDGWYAPIHDPRYAEIEQIMGEIGVKFIQVVAYATEYAMDPQTASCVVSNAFGKVQGYKLLININARRWFTIQTDRIDMYSLPSIGKLFDINEPDFFLKLAQYLRKEKVLSLPKYWFVRLKLWWNK